MVALNCPSALSLPAALRVSPYSLSPISDGPEHHAVFGIVQRAGRPNPYSVFSQ